MADGGQDKAVNGAPTTGSKPAAPASMSELQGKYESLKTKLKVSGVCTRVHPSFIFIFGSGMIKGDHRQLN